MKRALITGITDQAGAYAEFLLAQAYGAHGSKHCSLPFNAEHVGELVFDADKRGGTQLKLLDPRRLSFLGRQTSLSLQSGSQRTVDAFLST